MLLWQIFMAAWHMSTQRRRAAIKCDGLSAVDEMKLSSLISTQAALISRRAIFMITLFSADIVTDLLLLSPYVASIAVFTEFIRRIEVNSFRLSCSVDKLVIFQ